MCNRGAGEMKVVGESLRAVLDGGVAAGGRGGDRGRGRRPLFPAGLEAEKS